VLPFTGSLVLAESNGSLLPGLWRDSLHVTCGLTTCTPGSAQGPTLGNEYGKTLRLPYCPKRKRRKATVFRSLQGGDFQGLKTQSEMKNQQICIKLTIPRKIRISVNKVDHAHT